MLGSSNGVDLTRFEADKSVRFTGFVPDVSEYVARSWLSVVPLRIGAGTRLKIVESMAVGTPVVSTSKGAEGLAVTDGENILIADDPESFARAIARVIDDAELRLRLSENGRQLVSAKYSARAMGRSFSTLIHQVCGAARIASDSRYAHSTKATGVDSRAPFKSDGLKDYN